MSGEEVKKTPRKCNLPGPGPGRPKGVPNKTTTALKEMILNALDAAGGEEYLQRQAETNPGPFMTLLGKVLPSQIQAELSGKDGKDLNIKVIFEGPEGK